MGEFNATVCHVSTLIQQYQKLKCMCYKYTEKQEGSNWDNIYTIK